MNTPAGLPARWRARTTAHGAGREPAKVGITNVVAEKARGNATRVGYLGYPPLLERPYYRIYLLGDYGFIVMKEPAPLKALRW